MEGIQSVIIVGAGIFGLSTAIAFGERYPNIQITIIDRYEPPVPDGTSVDTSRCIRFDYPQKLYFKLAYEAVELIKKDPLISPLFHECGMSFIYDGIDKEWGEKWLKRYNNAKLANSNNDLSKVKYYDNSTEVFQSVHGLNSIPLEKSTSWNKGYTNYSCGYIEADYAIKIYYNRAKSFSNIKFIFKEVEKIIYKDKTNIAKGIKFINDDDDNNNLYSDLIIISAGAWSCKLVNLDNITEQSALAVAWLKITKEEEIKWSNMPITSNMSSGINIFPPFSGEIKCIKRFNGYKNTINLNDPNPFAKSSSTKLISYPRTIIDNKLDWIPQDAEFVLRNALSEIMPTLANRPFHKTKLCWVTDTSTDNFLIDYHPDLQNVLLATAGCGHAWKFVSLIGDKVLDFIQGDLDLDLKNAWSWKEKKNINKVSRSNGYGDLQEISSIIRKNPLM